MLGTDGSLFDDFELKGKWWLPQKPDQSVPGTLFFKPGDRIRLELAGSFADSSSPFNSGPHQPGAILGVTEDGKPCTLYKPIQSSFRGSLTAQISSSTFITHRLYVGKHFQSKDEIRFTSMSVEMTYLEEWALSGFLGIEHLNEGVHRITVPYISRDIFTSKVVSRNASVSLRSNWSLTFSGIEAHCKHFVDLHILPDDARDNEWFDAFQRDCSDLLTLFIGEAVYPSRVTAYGDDVETAPGRTTKERIQVYTVLSTPKRRERIYAHEMLVPFAEIKNEAQRLVENWFANSEKLEPVYTLLTATYYNRHIYVESQFLALMQAIETFHRRQLGGKYVAEHDYEECYARLVGALPPDTAPDLKERLKQYLRYGNEFSLRKRITQILACFSESTRKRVADDLGEFVEKLVATRNYLTHYDERKGNVIRGIESYFSVNTTLKAILTLLLLIQIGLQEEETAARIIFRHEL